MLPADRKLFPTVYEHDAANDGGYVEIEQFERTLSHCLGDPDVQDNLIDVCKSLQYMHEKLGFLHLNVCPQHIGLRADGSAALLDFNDVESAEQLPDLPGGDKTRAYPLAVEAGVPANFTFGNILQHQRGFMPLQPMHDLESLLYVLLHSWLLQAGTEGLPWADIHPPRPSTTYAIVPGEDRILAQKQRLQAAMSEAAPTAPYDALTPEQRSAVAQWLQQAKEAPDAPRYNVLTTTLPSKTAVAASWSVAAAAPTCTTIPANTPVHESPAACASAGVA